MKEGRRRSRCCWSAGLSACAGAACGGVVVQHVLVVVVQHVLVRGVAAVIRRGSATEKGEDGEDAGPALHHLHQ